MNFFPEKKFVQHKRCNGYQTKIFDITFSLVAQKKNEIKLNQENLIAGVISYENLD